MNTNETSARPPGYWFGVIEYRMREKMREALAELDLSRGEWRILHTLADGPKSVDDVESALPPGERHRRMGARFGRRGLTGRLCKDRRLDDDTVVAGVFDGQDC